MRRLFPFGAGERSTVATYVVLTTVFRVWRSSVTTTAGPGDTAFGAECGSSSSSGSVDDPSSSEASDCDDPEEVTETGL